MQHWKRETIRNWSPQAFLAFVLVIGVWEGFLLFQRSSFSIRTQRSSAPDRAARLREGSPRPVPATVLAAEKALSAPRVRMKKPDGHGPGITITGSGWQPGETVNLELHEISKPGLDQTFSATADAMGDIFNDQFAPDVGEARVSFLLTAIGRNSGFKAQARFTDRPLARKEPCTRSDQENDGPCVSKRQNRNQRSSRPFVVGSLAVERLRLPGDPDMRTWRDPSSCP